LDFGWFGKAHVIDPFEEVPVSGSTWDYNGRDNDMGKLTGRVLRMSSRCTRESLGPIVGRPTLPKTRGQLVGIVHNLKYATPRTVTSNVDLISSVSVPERIPITS